MENEGYKDFIKDLVLELIQLTRNQDALDVNDDFNQGYNSALYAVIHLVESQADSWGIDRAEIGFNLFNSDDWRRGNSTSGLSS